MIEQVMISGLLYGLIYALLSLGFTLIYGYSGLLNLAHGAFYMIGTYLFAMLAYTLPTYVTVDIPYLQIILASILACVITGFIGAIYYKVTLSPLVGDELSILIVSSCACIIFQQLVWLSVGSTRAMQFIIPQIIKGNIFIFGLLVSNNLLLSAALSFVLFIFMSLFVSKTKIGRSMKALHQDTEAAMLMGINRERIYMLTTLLSSILSCISGIFIISSTIRTTSVYVWLEPLAVSFAIVVLGGVGSIMGTLLGGLIFGFSTAIVVELLPEGGFIVPAVPFFILIFILTVRPKGLLGKRIEME